MAQGKKLLQYLIRYTDTSKVLEYLDVPGDFKSFPTAMFDILTFLSQPVTYLYSCLAR